MTVMAAVKTERTLAIDEQFLSTKDVLAFFAERGISMHFNTFFSMCKRGELPSVKIAGRIYVRKAALDQFLGIVW